MGYGQSDVDIKVDSLKQIINHSEKSSDILKAYLAWDDLIYASDPDLDLKLNLTVDSLGSIFIKRPNDRKELER
ncbi:MAG: hypothetical protein GQ574_24855 [Crocinitomix sp.]|nr:hypothetical protein [Crocinitomix sp.]